MEIFSEIYNCYYQIMKNILSQTNAISLEDLQLQITKDSSPESLLYLVPKLTSGEWDLFERNGDLFISKISDNFYTPLTDLQKSYIKTILSDEKIRLFLEQNQISYIEQMLNNTPVLWDSNDFYYYDQYSNGDPFTDINYISNFRTILHAISNNQLLDITYSSGTTPRIHHHYLPCRLEYSIRNNKFRLLATTKKSTYKHIVTLNLERITDVSLLNKFEHNAPDINRLIMDSYYKEPVKLLIHTDRNALERTMLHFANYEKNTKKLNDNTYECLIYYNKNMETELLIETLSFGPTVEVVENSIFLDQVRTRLKKQKRLYDSR